MPPTSVDIRDLANVESLCLPELAQEPDPPTSGKKCLFVDDAGVKVKDSAGQVTALGSGGTHPDLAAHTAMGLAAASDLTPLAADADLAAHASDTTSVHGIADTADLVLTSDSRLSDARTPTNHNIITAHTGFPGGTTNFLRADGTFAAPPSGGGGGGSTVVKKSADQPITGTAFADISDFTVPCGALEARTLDVLLVFSSSATTNGFKFAVVTPGWTPLRFLATFEYQTSATAWATFTQTSPTAFMAATSSSYVANSGIMCRALIQVEADVTSGNIQLQAAAETAAGVITIRKGNTMRYM